MREKTRKKLHRPLLLGLEEGLKRIFIENEKSDYVVPSLLRKNKKWGSRDRAFIAENTYEMVRNKRLVLHMISKEEVENESDLKPMIGAWLLTKGYPGEGEFFEGLDPEQVMVKKEAVSDPAVQHSVSDDLFQFIVDEIGEEKWLTELKSMDSKADIYIRTNLRYISREDLRESLGTKGIETEIVEDTKGGLRLLKSANLIQTEEFRNGFFEIQDAGSQKIVEFLDPKPGKIIIDTCAGAGGKTLHLADYISDNGEVIAMDIEEGKLEILNRRKERNNALSVSTHLIESTVLDQYQEKADYVLIDAPCSGLGVIRRNPDTKNTLKPQFIDEVKKVQYDIIKEYSKMLKSGGSMVYATCSILPSENEMQVQLFLIENKGFELIKEKQIWPSESNYDGFYMALLKKL